MSKLLTQNLIYLDHAAATPQLAIVSEQHQNLCTKFYLNPHSGHSHSEQALSKVVQVERQLLKYLAIPPRKTDVIWTSGGTEAINLGIFGVLHSNVKNICLVESSSHAAMLNASDAITNQNNTINFFPITATGKLDFEKASEVCSRDTNLVAVCHLNNETGVIQDLCELRNWMDRHTPKALLLVDAVQSFCKIPIPWQEAKIDLLAISSRKIGGPFSCGALLVKPSITLKPMIFGGGQQHGIRSGTLDCINIFEFGIAIKEQFQYINENFAKVQDINFYAREKLAQHDKYHPDFISPKDASPYILACSFPGFEGAIIMRQLAMKNILIGKGSACSAESAKISHVAKSMKLDDKLARGIIRLSFSKETDFNDIDIFCDELFKILEEY